MAIDLAASPESGASTARKFHGRRRLGRRWPLPRTFGPRPSGSSRTPPPSKPPVPVPRDGPRRASAADVRAAERTSPVAIAAAAPEPCLRTRHSECEPPACAPATATPAAGGAIAPDLDTRAQGRAGPRPGSAPTRTGARPCGGPRGRRGAVRRGAAVPRAASPGACPAHHRQIGPGLTARDGTPGGL
jgi:hypothetical protein